MEFRSLALFAKVEIVPASVLEAYGYSPPRTVPVTPHHQPFLVPEVEPSFASLL